MPWRAVLCCAGGAHSLGHDACCACWHATHVGAAWHDARRGNALPHCLPAGAHELQPSASLDMTCFHLVQAGSQMAAQHSKRGRGHSMSFQSLWSHNEECLHNCRCLGPTHQQETPLFAYSLLGVLWLCPADGANCHGPHATTHGCTGHVCSHANAGSNVPSCSSR
jgi:hypothetical protein